jgi:hypothetical protein
VFTITVLDSTDGWLLKCGVSYAYLQNRAQKALDAVLPTKFKVATVSAGRFAQADIGRLKADATLLFVAIVKRGQESDVSGLLRTADAKTASKDMSLLKAVCEGSSGERGFAVGRLAFVGISEAYPLDGLEQQNARFVSNVLVHEIGHMVLTILTARNDEDRDHRTMAVMRFAIPTTDPELSYSDAFKKTAEGKLAGAHKHRH